MITAIFCPKMRYKKFCKLGEYNVIFKSLTFTKNLIIFENMFFLLPKDYLCCFFIPVVWWFLPVAVPSFEERN